MEKLIICHNVSGIILFVISCLVPPSTADFENCNAIYVRGGIAESPGKCVTFPECPVLFDILKSRTRTIAELKLLQSLTCKPDNENPTVCCAIDDIVSDTENFNIANKPGSNAVAPNPDNIVFGVDPKQQEPEKGVHPNFRLLPSLKECSQTVQDERIIGGKDVSILQYPWMARIGYYSYEEENIKYLCGGTVINKRYILSAAHCTQEINKDEYEPREIRLQEKDKTCDDIYGCSSPMDIKIEKVIPHPNYNRKDKSNDISLIRLAEDIPYEKTPFIQPVCLPFIEEYGLSRDIVDPLLTRYLDKGTKEATVAGWGKTRWTNGGGSETLMYVSLPVLSTRQCQMNYRNHTSLTITDKQLCAGGQPGEDSCSGDSGGGLFNAEKIPYTLISSKKTGIDYISKTFQYGVVSFGPTHCGVGGLPGVYSNVYAYRKWILDHLEP